MAVVVQHESTSRLVTSESLTLLEADGLEEVHALEEFVAIGQGDAPRALVLVPILARMVIQVRREDREG